MEKEEKLEAYLTDAMSAEERVSFEKELAADRELQEALKLHKEIDDILAEDAVPDRTATDDHPRVETYRKFLFSEDGHDTINLLERADAAYFAEQEEPVDSRRNFISYLVAASFLILAAVAVFFMVRETPADQLYMSYKDSATLPSFTSRDTDSALAQAEKLVKDKQYTKALPLLQANKNTKSGKINPQVYIYLGVCYLETGETDKARATFDTLLQSDTLDAPKAHWYLALTYLKTGNKAEAVSQLEMLRKKSGFNKRSVELLLDDLK